MEWYAAVIILLSASSIGGMIFILDMIGMIDDLRIENAKLRIDLNHK